MQFKDGLAPVKKQPAEMLPGPVAQPRGAGPAGPVQVQAAPVPQALLGAGGGQAEHLARAFRGLVETEGASDSLAGGQVAAAPQKPGLYPGVTDLTGKYGGLSAGTRKSTDGVVLHRTESSSAASTLSGYAERIKSGSSIGAQYLIDEKGATSLVTPLDSMVSHAKGFSNATVGVEVVGPASKLDRSGKKGTLREQVAAMDLSPEFQARLLGYSDKQLSNVAKWNGDQIYQDVSGAQKRSVWNLSSSLATEYGLDLGSTSKAGKDESGTDSYSLQTLPDFSAHEHINPKAMGEGEAMIEFLRARKQYPALVAQAQTRLEALRAAGGDPAQIEQLAALLAREQGTLGALGVDGTQGELDALQAEKDAGKPGEASAREQQRVDFYDNFYDRIGGLKDATAD